MLTVSLSLAGCVAINAPPPPRELTVLKHEVHSQCPLAVNHPSVLLVRSPRVWAKMMADAHAVPPPYDAAATDFARQSVLVVALAPTPAPTTLIVVPRERAVLFSLVSRKLEVTLQVIEPTRPPTAMLPTVVGLPCLVAWVPAVGDVASVIARTTDGKLLGERTL